MNVNAVHVSGFRLLVMATVFAPLRANLGRAMLAVVAIALGVALGFAIFLMNRAATREMNAATRSLFGEADLVVAGTSAGFDESWYPLIARQPQIALASPVLEVNGLAKASGNAFKLLGIDLLRVARLQPSVPTAKRDLDTLSIFDPQRIMLSAAAAGQENLPVGSTLVVHVDDRDVTFTVGGILPADAYRESVGVIDIAAAQWRLQRLGRLTRIDLRLATGADPRVVAQRLRNLVPAGMKVTTAALESQDARQLSRAFATNLTALGLVALFTGGFLIYSMQALNVMRRRREFALLHALGMSARQRIGSVVATGVMLGTIGALLGVVLGALLAGVGLQVLGSNLGPGFSSDTAPQLALGPTEFIGFTVLGILVAALGSIAPALAAARVPTAAALKAGDLAETSTAGPSYIALALWLAAVPLLFAPPISGLPLLGYAAIVCVLFGAVLFMPAFTRSALAWLPSIANVSYQAAVSQLRGTVRQATVSIASILVSISLMVAMAIMVASLRGSFAQWLDRLLPADIYVQAGGASRAAFIDPTIIDTLSTLPGIARTEQGRSIDLLLPGERTPIVLVARPLQHPERSMVVDSKAPTTAPAGSVPIFISVALADRLHLPAGAALEFSIDGRPLRGFVSGIARDYSAASGTILMDIERYRQLTRDTHTNLLSLWLKPGASFDAAFAAVKAHVDDSATSVRAPRDIRERSLSIFDRTFAITYLLEALAVLIGMFGISVSASAQVVARRAEFGVLRHLGFTRRQVGSLLAIDGLLMGALGVLAGLASGTVISAILIYVVGRQSFHWVMDLHVPVPGLLVLACCVPLAAALTARWSGRAALSDDVLRAVKEDW